MLPASPAWVTPSRSPGSTPGHAQAPDPNDGSAGRDLEGYERSSFWGARLPRLGRSAKAKELELAGSQPGPRHPRPGPQTRGAQVPARLSSAPSPALRASAAHALPAPPPWSPPLHPRSQPGCPLLRWRRRRRGAVPHVGAGGQWASGLRLRPGAGGGSAAGRRLRPGCGPCRLHNSLRAPRGPTSRLPATPGCAEPHGVVRCRRLPPEVRPRDSGLRGGCRARPGAEAGRREAAARAGAGGVSGAGPGALRWPWLGKGRPGRSLEAGGRPRQPEPGRLRGASGRAGPGARAGRGRGGQRPRTPGCRGARVSAFGGRRPFCLGRLGARPRDELVGSLEPEGSVPLAPAESRSGRGVWPSLSSALCRRLSRLGRGFGTCCADCSCLPAYELLKAGACGLVVSASSSAVHFGMRTNQFLTFLIVY